MRSLNLVILLALGLVLAAGNLWYAAARSLIPLALDSRVQRIELRREKHPGLDDVYLVSFDDGRLLQVDQPIAAVLTEGVLVEKSAWSRTVRVGERTIKLSLSADFWGMAKCMPIVAAIIAATAWMLATSDRQQRRHAEPYPHAKRQSG